MSSDTRASLSKAKKIAHVFPSRSFGGAEIYLLELAEAQMKAGWDVVAWVTKGARLEREAQARGLAVLDHPVSQRMKLSALFGLAKVIRREKITHLHLHWSGGPWAFWGIKRLAKVKIVYHVHMWVKHSKKDPVHWSVYRAIDRVIVAGPRLKSMALKCLPIPERKYVEVPYAIHTRAVTPVSTGLGEGLFLFGMFARIDRQKGQKEFLLALEGLLEKGLPVAGLLVGDPTHGESEAEEYNQEIREILNRPVFSGRVLQKPFSQDYQSWLAACEVLVAPSYHECYALILLHSFSLGVPVLSTDSGGTPDLVTPERGWLVPPRQVEALASQMERIVGARDQVQSKGEVARKQVIAQHSFGRILELISKVY